MRHYDYKKQDNRAGSAFIPHEAAGDYELPNTSHAASGLHDDAHRSLLRVGGRPKLLELARRSVHGQCARRSTT